MIQLVERDSPKTKSYLLEAGWLMFTDEQFQELMISLANNLISLANNFTS